MIDNERNRQMIMFAQERQTKVVELLRTRSSVSVPELGRLLRASPATVRRDLDFLEQAGKIRRTHGGVLPLEPGELPYSRKSRRELGAKKAIAELAAGLVRDGDTVFVDAGTTAFKVGLQLVARPRVTIVTNSLPLLGETRAAGARVIALGGEVRAVSLALVGSEAMEWMKRLRLDLAFIGASGIDSANGPCTTELGESAVKLAAVRRARRAILVADASKWERQAPILFAGWDQFDDLITDHSPTTAEAAALSHHRVRLHSVAI